MAPVLERSVIPHRSEPHREVSGQQAAEGSMTASFHGSVCRKAWVRQVSRLGVSWSRAESTCLVLGVRTG